MKSKLHGGAVNLSLSTSANRYVPPMAPTAFVTSSVKVLIPCAGVFRKLRAKLTGNPTSDNSSIHGYDIKLYWATGTNATAATTQVASIRGDTAGFAAESAGADVAVSAGDHFEIVGVPVSPNNAPGLCWEIEFESTATDETILAGGGGYHWLPADAGPNYGPLAGTSAAGGTTEAHANLVAPCAGTITALYGRLDSVPGTGYTRTASVRVNGADQGTGISWGAAESGVKSASQGTPIAVAAGDRLTIGWTVAGGVTPATATCAWAVTFKPTTSGDFIIPYSASQYDLSSVDQFMCPSASQVALASTEGITNQGILGADFTITALATWLEVVPGGTGTRTITLREAGAAAGTPFTTAYTAAQNGSKVTTGGPFTPTLWTAYGTKWAPANSPAASACAASYLGHLEPAGAGGVLPSSLALLGMG